MSTAPVGTSPAGTAVYHDTATDLRPAAKSGQADRMGIVVVNYGSSDLVARNLGALDLDSDTVDVVLVDNFSTREESERARALARAQDWHFVAKASNEGFGAGVNAGIREADRLGCVCFLLLNPDALVPAEVIAELRTHCVREPLALVSPVLESSRRETLFAGSRLDLRTGDIRGAGSSRPARRAGGRRQGGSREPAPDSSVDWLPATCLAVHRDLITRAGGFDVEYFLYWEDVDFSRRCVRAGGTLRIRDDLRAVHDAGGTQGPQRGRAKSSIYYRYNCRNRLLFATRHLSRRELLTWMLYTPVESWQILLRGGRRQLLHSPKPLIAAVRGSIEGLALAVAALLQRRGRPANRQPSVLAEHYASAATDPATDAGRLR